MLAWQQQLKEAITDPDILCDVLEIDQKYITEIKAAIHQFPLRVPQSFISRIEKGNPKDPLLQQILPQAVEMQSVPGYVEDPLQESSVSPAYGLLHKYHGRVLLMATGACAVHCRYCFRRHYPYSEQVPGISQWQPALDYIEKHPSIKEVILSGGDPLVLKDELLSRLIRQLESITHVKRLRIHTRLPLMIPDRITDSLVSLLQNSRFRIIMVLHCNHAKELDHSVAQSILKCKNITLLNQAVLLKGVNDSAETLIQLSEDLFQIGVLPYYLHCLDPVAGVAHFNVSKEKAICWVKVMESRLPGYLVPKLVCEVPEKKSKQLVF